MPKGIYPRGISSSSTYTWQEHLPTLIACISTESDAISYLVKHGILKCPTEFTCYYCAYVGCRVKSKNNRKSLKCNRGSCGRSLSLLRGTIFSGSKTPLHQILYICCFFLSLAPPSTVISQLHCSSNTASNWYSRLRKWILKHNTTVFNGEEARKEHAFKRARKKDEVEHSAVALWRAKHEHDLWNAFLNVLKCHDDVVDSLDGECSEKERAFNVVAHNVVAHHEVPPLHNFEGESELPIVNVENEESEIVNGDIESLQVRWNALISADCEPGRQHSEAKANVPRKRLASESFAIDINDTCNPNLHIGHQSNEQQRSECVQSYLSEEPMEVQERTSRKRPKMKQSIPSFLDLCCLMPSDEKAIEYLTSHGIFIHPKETICTHCGYKGLRRKQKKNFKSLKCNRCNKGQSIARGTFFEHTKANIRTILQLAAHWLHKIPRVDSISQLKCSSATVTEFYRSFRKIVKQNMSEDLRVVALTADNNSMAQKIPKGARRNELDEHYCVVLWREVNKENLWEAFLAALRRCSLTDSSNGSGFFVESRDQVWIDGEKGTACCKYHLKLHFQEVNG